MNEGHNHTRIVYCDLCKAKNVFGSDEGPKPCVLCAEEVEPHKYDVILRYDTAQGDFTLTMGNAFTLSEAVSIAEKKMDEELGQGAWNYDIRYCGEDIL